MATKDSDFKKNCKDLLIGTALLVGGTYAGAKLYNENKNAAEGIAMLCYAAATATFITVAAREKDLSL